MHASLPKQFPSLPFFIRLFALSFFIIFTVNTFSRTIDVQGPLIDLYINDKSFHENDVVGENPTLVACLHDESGINTVGNSFGHAIIAVLDNNATKKLEMNPYYVVDAGSYQKGTIHYKFNNLADGPHTFQLQVWDIFDNPSEAIIHFVVSKNLEIAIAEVTAFPNPCSFKEPIVLSVTHNLFDAAVDVKVDIFSLSGKLVKTIGPLSLQSSGYHIAPITWDGRDVYQNDVRGGMYIYHIQAVDQKDAVSEKSGKIIVVRNYIPL
jgi:hypothetical protein